MGDVKATTVAQRFGFKDPQLSTPAHDEIMLSIAADPGDLIGGLQKPEPGAVSCRFNVTWEWPIVSENTRTGQKFSVGFVDMRLDWREEVAKMHSCKKLTKKELRARYADYAAEPVPHDTRENRYTDVISYVAGYRWDKNECSLRECTNYYRSYNRFLLVEVKPSTPSLGELMRQIQMYRTYVDATYVIATPDETFAAEIAAMPNILYYNTKKLVEKYRRSKLQGAKK